HLHLARSLSLAAPSSLPLDLDPSRSARISPARRSPPPDPALAKDSEQDTLTNITLSYTFYPVSEPDRPVADSANSEQSGHI
ncbi:MAG TPA: hypothetical protein VEF90_13825, partial [Xanthobacteraceae bacterium]|nr:hypothetical protein [Xanthobacteraceae bacterium]